jgi:hypothetical protein
MIDKRALLSRLAVLGGLAFSLPVYAQYSTPMHDVDNGARQPVNFAASIVVNSGNQIGSNNTAVTIPAGKRLVIETLSFFGFVTIGETGYIRIQVTAGAGTAAGATSVAHIIPLVKLSADPISDYLGGNAALRMYADAGSTVTVTYQRGTTGTNAESMQMFITGHFVNLP